MEQAGTSRRGSGDWRLLSAHVEQGRVARVARSKLSFAELSRELGVERRQWSWGSSSARPPDWARRRVCEERPRAPRYSNGDDQVVTSQVRGDELIEPSGATPFARLLYREPVNGSSFAAINGALSRHHRGLLPLTS